MEDTDAKNTVPPAAGDGARKVLQPVSDMSAYVTQQTHEPAPQAAPAPPPPPSAAGSQAAAGEESKPAQTSSLYPSVTQGVSGAPTPSIDAAQGPNLVADPTTKKKPGRVSAEVQPLLVYAILILIYSIYSLATTLPVLLKVTEASQTVDLTTVSIILLVAGAINITAGVCFLLSKSYKLVSAILTVLLILGGISLLNTFVTLTRFMNLDGLANFNPAGLIAPGIQLGMFIFLWSVRSRVEDARLEREL